MYTIPFDSATLKQIIIGEISNPVVDYTNSKIKGKNFITYFSNLKYENINVDLKDVSVDERFELIKEYIKHQSIVHIEQFEATMVKLVFAFKGINVDNSEFDKPYLDLSVLSSDEIEQFITTNEQLVLDLVEILDGVILYAIKNLNSFKEEHGDKVTTNTVSEKTEVGKTFVNLFKNETFNCHYYSVLPSMDRIKYFEHYYDRPIYSGKILVSYIVEGCVLFPLLKMVVDKEYTKEQLIAIGKELDATPI